MSGSVASSCCNSTWTIVFDDSCPMVGKLSWILARWDKQGAFTYIGRDSDDPQAAALLRQMDSSNWSLLVFDEWGDAWYGPEAIPFILKNLPGGKLAAVTYTLPGTMWLTRTIYRTLSKNRQLFSQPTNLLVAETLPSDS